MARTTDEQRDPSVLLVDDDAGDVLLITGALQSVLPRVSVRTANSGAEALRMLRRQPPHEGYQRPQVIFLDLNMPGVNGQEVLSSIKADTDLKTIPVIILTTSAEEADIAWAYRRYANAYITKPPTLRELERVLDDTQRFWFNTAELPRLA